MKDNRHAIWSDQQIIEWNEGYPIGNGRLGAMVLGGALNERIGLNHDMLLRRYWKYQKRNFAEIIPEMRSLCLDEKWDEAHELVLTKLPSSGRPLYVNPLMPASDLGLFQEARDGAQDDIKNYSRTLDMETGIVTVEYEIDGVLYKREHFCSWHAGVIVVRLNSPNRVGHLSGQVTLSRLLDPDCEISGSSKLGEVALECEFEEGVRFATAVKVLQHGGRLTNGRREYTPIGGEIPGPDLNGMSFIFREPEALERSAGVSTCFDSCDEVTLLIAVSTDDEADNPLEYCLNKLADVPADYEELKRQHIADHKSIYNRVSLNIAEQHTSRTTADLIKEAIDTDQSSPELVEKMFNMGRYMAINSGRPAPAGQPFSTPITLQGIWNQDRRPAWDCDYHLDLNFTMCYWPLEMVNLSDHLIPVMDWVEHVLPQARIACQDMFGCDGVWFAGCCDRNTLGNSDDLGFYWASGAPWVAQILWHHWEYSGDVDFLRDRLYPFLKELATFYKGALWENEDGQLVIFPGYSPEMGIKNRKRYCAISSPSTMDIELSREVLTNVLAASELLGMDDNMRAEWSQMLSKIPQPVIGERGDLLEWMEDHEPVDPGHRHRSHFVSMSPGDRITPEDTPEYSEAIRKSLEVRQTSGRDRGCSLTWVWDQHIRSRLYEGDKAMFEFNFNAKNHVMDNLLMSLLDWRETSTTLNWFQRRIFQIEAGIGMVASIAEMFFQDRRGLLRLLPALPTSLADGNLTGFRARGGFEVDLAWKAGKLTEAKITSLRGTPCRVKFFGGETAVNVEADGKSQKLTVADACIEFPTETGKTYTITPA